jgi:hypothetical protein
MTNQHTVYAFVVDDRIDDVRSFSAADLPLLNRAARAAAEPGRWVSVACLQSHPDLIYFCPESFHKVSDSDETLCNGSAGG